MRNTTKSIPSLKRGPSICHQINGRLIAIRKKNARQWNDQLLLIKLVRYSPCLDFFLFFLLLLFFSFFPTTRVYCRRAVSGRARAYFPAISHKNRECSFSRLSLIVMNLENRGTGWLISRSRRKGCSPVVARCHGLFGMPTFNGGKRRQGL